MRLFRQEYWSGLPCPPPVNLLKQGIEPMSPVSPALVGGFFTTSATWEDLSLWDGPNAGLQLCHLWSVLFAHCWTLCLMDSWCSANIYDLPLFQFQRCRKRVLVWPFMWLILCTSAVFLTITVFLYFGLLKSFVGRSLRGIQASFHLYTFISDLFLSLPSTVFFLPPFLWPR